MVAKATAQVTENMATFGETVRYLSKSKAYWYLAWAAGIRAFLGYAAATFFPSFLYRSHTDGVVALAHSLVDSANAFDVLAHNEVAAYHLPWVSAPRANVLTWALGADS